MSKNRSPYQSPCGAPPCSPLTLLYGDTFQQVHKSEQQIPIFTNSTLVNGCAPVTFGSGYGGGPTCSLYYDGTNNCSNTGNICGAWTDYPLPNSSSQYYGNIYSASGTTKNLSLCKKVGYKNKQAMTRHFGRPPFVTTGGSTKYLSVSIAFSYYYYETNYDTGNPSSDYTYSIVVSCSYALNIDPMSGLWSCSGYTYTFTPSATGTVTATPPTDGIPNLGTPFDGYIQGVAMNLFPAVFPTGTDTGLLSSQTEPLGLATTDAGPGGTYPTILADTVTDTELHFNIQNGTQSSPVSVVEHYTDANGVAQTSGETYAQGCEITVTLSGIQTIADVVDTTKGLSARINMTDDAAYPWRTDARVGCAPLVTYNQKPDGPYRPDDVPQPGIQFFNADVYSTAVIPGGWDIYDPDSGQQDVQYIFQGNYPAGTIITLGSVLNVTAASVLHGALVPGCSLQVNGGKAQLVFAADSPGTGQPGYQEAVVIHITGQQKYDDSVLGLLNPAGYGYNADGSFRGHFDFRAIVWESVSGTLTAIGNGAWTPNFLPANCTQWTNLEAEQTGFFVNASVGGSSATVRAFPKGAWSFYNSLGSVGIVWIQEWAEIKCVWPSYNFSRPCGASDRALIDQTTATCGTDDNGNPIVTGGTARFPSAPDCNPDDPWNDTMPKGGFVYAVWQPSGLPTSGTVTTQTTQYCVAFLQCDPQVMCISSGGEIFTSGVKIASPILAADITNGGWVACDVFQIMYDLLWQPPGCGQSAVVPPNFPPPPMVEALNGYPSRVPDCSSVTSTVTPATDSVYPHPLPSGIGFPPYPTSVDVPKMPNGIIDPSGWPWQHCPATIPNS